jgi:hypothetical protein
MVRYFLALSVLAIIAGNQFAQITIENYKCNGNQSLRCPTCINYVDPPSGKLYSCGQTDGPWVEECRFEMGFLCNTKPPVICSGVKYKQPDCQGAPVGGCNVFSFGGCF